MNKNLESELYRKMFLIRIVEEHLLDLFSKGKLFGTTHTYIGQEADAAGVISRLRPTTDVVFSNHRCHGHYLALTGDVAGLLQEVMGKAGGVCGGVGGSQHLCRDNFYSNGILGGTVPTAAGVAFAEKKLGRDGVTVSFLGDGTLGQGVVYESMNIASLWSLPILFVIENNYYAQSTPSRLQIAGEIASRPRAFGIETAELTTNDAAIIYDAAGPIIDEIRLRSRPACLVLNTYRLSAHSKSDDFRNPGEIENWKMKDPLRIMRPRLPDAVAREIEEACHLEVDAAVEEALQAPFSDPATIYEGVN
jgi:TPP-dependent pyruvate/acetoin dehydrogenase alpha subunit